MSVKGHRDRKGNTKISYSSLEKALDSARRRAIDLGKDFRVYRCRDKSNVRKGRPEHWHVGTTTRHKHWKDLPQTEMDHLELDPPPTSVNDRKSHRVSGCISSENNDIPKRRLAVILKRWNGVYKRFGRYDLAAKLEIKTGKHR